MFDRASAAIGIDLWDAGLHAPQEKLALPSILQPFLVAWAAADVERGRAVHPGLPTFDFVMGHSSGENTALALSGAVAFETAVRFAHQRGKHQDQACAGEPSGLIALAGLDQKKVGALTVQLGLSLANHNGADQFVLGGALASLVQAQQAAEAEGIPSTILRVAGAFHTERFREADVQSEALIDSLAVNPQFTPMIGNARGQIIRTPDALREELRSQYSRPIRWVEALQTAYDCGVRIFVVTGPGNAMHGLIRRFARTTAEPLETIRLNRPVRSASERHA